MKNQLLLAYGYFTLVLCLGIAVSAEASICYVNGESTAENPDGSSWEKAYKDLQSAVDAAEAQGGGEIWVAEGRYTSTEDPVLTMKEGVALYGGFAGTETSRDQRDWEANESIIDGQDKRRCVKGSNDGVLNGFIVTGGYFTGSDSSGGMFNNDSSPTVTNCTFTKNRADSYGGGMYNHNSAPTVTNCNFIENSSPYVGGIWNVDSSPTVTNCTFHGNRADLFGGGMRNENSSPTLTNCIFHENTAAFGGGIWNENSSPRVIDCTFTKNRADLHGGGIFNENSSPTVTNCSFTENTADTSGGGVVNFNSFATITNCTFHENTAEKAGGIYNQNSSTTITNCSFTENTGVQGGGIFNAGSSPTVTNCSFTGNMAYAWGGGMYNFNSSPTITNCTFHGNTAKEWGGGINNDNSSPTVTNCIFWENKTQEIFNDDENSVPTVSYSCIQGGYEGTDNIDTDPLFVNAPADLRLSAESPCIDAGTSEGAPERDMVETLRPWGAGVDMGAYEYIPGSTEGEVTPVEGEVTPVEGEVVPVEGEVVPVEGEVVPVEGEGVPVEGEGVPVEGEVAPAEGEVVPVEGEGDGDAAKDPGCGCGSKNLQGATKDLLGDWLLMSLSLGVLLFGSAWRRNM